MNEEVIIDAIPFELEEGETDEHAHARLRLKMLRRMALRRVAAFGEATRMLLQAFEEPTEENLEAAKATLRKTHRLGGMVSQVNLTLIDQIQGYDDAGTLTAEQIREYADLLQLELASRATAVGLDVMAAAAIPDWSFQMADITVEFLNRLLVDGEGGSAVSEPPSSHP